MKLNVSATLTYGFGSATQVIAAIEAARSPDQTILSEELRIWPDTALIRDEDGATGERRFRAAFSGQVQITYRALIDNGERTLLPRDARQHDWSELPQDVLPYLLPSRFSPSDEFMRFAQREFRTVPTGGARVLAVLDWLHTHLDYVHGVSHAMTTAEQTFIDRAGVCRDFSHLGIALTRALNIPARAVSAYALDLDPPDFHAVYEIYLDGRWWLVDPTRLAPVEGMVRIASGRDAADIAFLTSEYNCQCLNQVITVTRADADAGQQAA
ncbi:transglutaminase-like domain-containing protein [Bosea lathyri]|uniref:Transglutaminase-like enzyme, putative cysteine protease n=1 Tax=Bosea lathyri TaxID=1036778 RepID=A0A1H5YMY6_9HYPH|nr:transglutaminase family protein [Bosea lathyri]SEG25523.1 Transglutaminase-like enzyme, putative cysteine protease [Bosea lathyri]